MKNLRIGNIFLMVLMVLIAGFLFFGGVDKIKKIRTTDLREEISVLRQEIKDRTSDAIVMNEKMQDRDRKNRDTLDIVRKISRKLADSINMLHISYMNDSYLKEHHNTDATFWFVNYTYRTWEKEDRKGKQTNWFINTIFKLDGQLSYVEIKNIILKKYDLKDRENLLVIKFFHQVSEKEYYKYLNDKK